MDSLTGNIFNINNESQFNKVALTVFNLQYKQNNVYSEFCHLMKVNAGDITNYTKIPFLPIEFFKTKKIITGENKNTEVIFSSSGTTGSVTSKHYVSDISVYEKSFLTCFEIFYGKPKDYCILALLPSYLERQGSSLVYMAKELIERSQNKASGFYLHNLKELKEKIAALKIKKQKTILLGVTYALLDLAAEMNITLNENFIVMETGGMKGQRKEMVREELHKTLCEKFGINSIHSEYGMTELLSQAYSKRNGVFECPAWMKVLIRDPYEPTILLPENKTGGINVIDLANINSCSFIATQDLGRVVGENTFEVSGRMNESDLRGCNLMVL